MTKSFRVAKSFYNLNPQFINTVKFQKPTKRNISTLFIAIIFAVQLVKAEEEKINAVGTVRPLSFVLNEIGGEYINVSTLIPSTVDIHSYEPSISDIKKLISAQIILANGYGIEGVLLKNVKQNNPSLILLEDEKNNFKHSKHSWLDPVLVKENLPKITLRLCNLLNSQCGYFKEREKNLSYRIQSKISQMESFFNSLSNKKFITVHPIWDLFALRFGLEQLGGIQECDTYSSTVNDVLLITKLVHENKLNRIVVDLNTATKAYEAILVDLNLKQVNIDPYGTKVNGYIEFLDSIESSFKELFS